jgi:hypothetical protein
MSTTPRLVPVRDTQGQIAGFRREDEPEPTPAPAPAAPAAQAEPSTSPASSTAEAQPPARRRVVELLPASAQAATGASTTAAPQARPGTGQTSAAAFVLGVLCTLAALALLSGSGQLTATRPTTVPTAQPVPTVTPPTPTSPTLGRALVAYDAPSGAVVGALEASRVYTATARYGDAWTRLEVEGSGALWVRAGDLGATVGPGLPDLAPTVTPTPTASSTPEPTEEPAPVVHPAQPVPCTEANAPYQINAVVRLEGRPVGEYRVWSCVSRADAERQAEAAEAAIRASAVATQTAQAKRGAR